MGSFEGRPNFVFYFFPPGRTPRETVAAYRRDGHWYMQEFLRYEVTFMSGKHPNEYEKTSTELTWRPEEEFFTLVTDPATIASFEEQFASRQLFGIRDPAPEATNISGSLEAYLAYQEEQRARAVGEKVKKRPKITW